MQSWHKSTSRGWTRRDFRETGYVGRGEGTLGLLLALLCISGVGGGGCGKPPEATPLKKQYVRWETLLPLHPSWAQVGSYEQREAEGRAFTLQSSQSTLALDTNPLPKPFQPPVAIPESLASEREKLLHIDDTRYHQDFVDTLLTRNREQWKRERRVQKKRLEADLKRQLEAEVKRLQGEKRREVTRLEQKIRILKFRDVGFLSQINVYSGQARTDAQLQHKMVLEQIAALELQGEGLKLDVRPAVERDWGKRRQEALTALDVQIEQAQRKQEAEIKAQQSTAQGTPPGEEEPLTPPGMVAPPTSDPRTTPLVLAFPLPSQWQASSQSGIGGEQAGISVGEKAKLINLILRDTRRAVTEIARQQHWQLVEPETPKATDNTPAVSEALRQLWSR